MFIRKLSISNFGRIKRGEYKFSNRLVLFKGDDLQEVIAALCIVSCNSILRFQPTRYRFTDDSKLHAQIEHNGRLYEVEGLYDEAAPANCSVRVCCGGAELTKEEQTEIFCTGLEEEECSCFMNRYDYFRYVPFEEHDFTKKLNEYFRYIHSGKLQEFLDRRHERCDEELFIHSLKNFCCQFKPVPLKHNKNIWLTMGNDGLFVAEDSGHVPVRISAEEDVLLQYMCFLHTNRFWSEVRSGSGYTAKKPIIIRQFIGCSDYTAEVPQLLDSTLEFGRQVFVFDESKNRRRPEIKSEKQVIFTDFGGHVR